MKKIIIILLAILSLNTFQSCAINKARHFERPEIIDDNSPIETEDSLTVSPFAEYPTSSKAETTASSETTKKAENTTDETTTQKKKETTAKQTEKVDDKIDYDDIDDFDIGDNINIDDDDDVKLEGDGNYVFIDSNLYEGKLITYDVPLPELKQMIAIDTASEFGIPVELMFGVMKVESNYTETVISKNGKYIGIMQIAKSNLNRLNKKFGITDLQDFMQNIKAGAYFLSYYYKKYNGDIDKTLMCYHRGEGGAQKKWAQGIYTDGYCTKVKNEMNRIIKAGIKEG